MEYPAEYLIPVLMSSSETKMIVSFFCGYSEIIGDASITLIIPTVLMTYITVLTERSKKLKPRSN